MQEDNSQPSGGSSSEEPIVEFPYLDRDEAMFLLGRVRDGAECSMCPRWSRGCTANLSRSDMLQTPLKQFIEKHVPGTEGHMCAKLRAIVNISDAELAELNKKFSNELKKRVSYLSRTGEKFVYANQSIEELIQQFDGVLQSQRKEVEAFYEQQILNIKLEANRMIDEALKEKDRFESERSYNQLADQHKKEVQDLRNLVKQLENEMGSLRNENTSLKKQFGVGNP